MRAKYHHLHSIKKIQVSAYFNIFEYTMTRLLITKFGKLFIVREHWGQNSIYVVIFPQKSFNLLEDRQILALMFPFIFV